MDVLALLERLDSYLSECPRVPLTGKLLVDEEEVFTLIDDLRAALPQELEQARWILRERDRILQEARKESEEILRDAQGQIAALASESVIAKEARAQAEELMERARQVAREINLGAREYADEIMKKVEDMLVELLESVRQGRRELSVDRDSSPRADEAGRTPEAKEPSGRPSQDENPDYDEFSPDEVQMRSKKRRVR